MDGRAPAAEHSEIALMQASERNWVLRAARQTARGLRSMPPGVLLALLSASALVPVLGTVVGAGAVAMAAGGVVSSLGGGVLSGILTEVVHHDGGGDAASSQSGLEQQIAAKIEHVLAAGDANAQALRAEISTLLGRIDAGGTALRAAMEAGDEQLRADIVAAFEALGSQYTELGFLLKDVARAVAGVQQGFDEQGVSLRAIQDQNDRERTDIRVFHDEVMLAVSRLAATVGAGGAGDSQGPRWTEGCPYRGLLPFGENDADIFYGRERLTAELTAMVAEQTTRGGLLIVTGASGAGKSSLLQAGLMRKLAEGQQVPGSRDWPRILMTPTADSLTELAGRLAAVSGTPLTAIRDELAKRPDEAHLTVWQAALSAAAGRGPSAPTDGDARLVLIVDQFEQLFTLNTGPAGKAAQQALITALCAAAGNPVGPARQPAALVIIAVRGDFFDRCADYPELANALRDGQFVVGPMTETDLRLAISGPAEAAGLGLGSGLMDTVLSDLGETGRGDAAGVLPLLSQAMALTWEKRGEDGQLTVRGYGEIGGVASAVETSAERVYGGLSPGRQELARQILRSMTAAGRDGKLTRRPLTRADLYAELRTAARLEVDAVLEAFAAERLVVLSESKVEISHDVLLRAWPRLRAWLQDDEASWLQHAALADDAADWLQNERNSSFLYRGTHLGSVRESAAQWEANPARYPALTPVEQEFLHRSQRADTRSTRLFQGGVALLAVLFVIATIAWGYGLKQQSTANAQRDEAIFNQTAAEAQQVAATNGPLAAQLNLAAYRMQQTKDLTSRLISMENTPMPATLESSASPSPVFAVAFGRALRPGGHLMATGTFTGTVRLWDVTAPGQARLLSQPVGGISTNAIAALAFSPDGQTLAISEHSDTVSSTQLWNVADPAHPGRLGRPLSMDGAESEALAFSSAGHLLVTADSDNTVRLWNVADPASARPVGNPLTGSSRGGVNTVAFSPSGPFLASGGFDDTLRVWNIAHPGTPVPLGQPLTVGTGPVDSVALSPDGRLLATGDYDGTVRLWNVPGSAGPQPLGQPLATADAVNSVAFSPDSPVLAAGGYDSTIQLWDIAEPANPQPLGQSLTAGTGTVFSVAFSPDGHTLASGSDDGTIRLWSLPPTVLTGPDGPLYTAAFSPDGRTLATGGADWKVRLWDVTNPADPRPLGQPLTTGSGSGYYAGVFSLAFSSERGLLAAGTGDGTVLLWSMADPANPRPLGQPLHVANPYDVIVALSPDGRTMATTLSSAQGVGAVQLWDITDPADPKTIGSPLTLDVNGSDEFYSVAFSPKHHLLAVGSAAEVIQLWNVANPAHAVQDGTFHASGTNTVSAVQFSPDSSTLAAGNYDGTVQLWNVANPANAVTLGAPLATGGSQGSSPVDSVAFSPDGKLLASGDDDGVVGMWNVADPAHPQQDGQPLTGHTSFVNAVAFSPDGQTLATGSNDETIQLSNLNVSAAIAHVCSQSSDDITASQWGMYIQQLSYRPPCAGS
jgi:WD40 repeat protein